MASLGGTYRYSLKYSSGSGSDNSARTISGLNIWRTTSYPETGAQRDPAITNLVDTIMDFSTGTISNVRWVQEIGVNL